MIMIMIKRIIIKIIIIIIYRLIKIMKINISNFPLVAPIVIERQIIHRMNQMMRLVMVGLRLLIIVIIIIKIMLYKIKINIIKTN